MKSKLSRWLAVDEVANQPLLQALYWVLLIGFFLTFRTWVNTEMISPHAGQRGQELCLPYFLNCAQWFFMEGPPYSYTLSIFYAFLGALLTAGAIFAAKKRWLEAMLCLLPPLLWKVLMLAVLTHEARVDYEYFHVPFVFVFLFSSRKAYFLRRTLVVLYLLSGLGRHTDSWIVGDYFSSLRLGLPLLPDWAIPFATNSVAALEAVGAWLLLSPNRRIRMPALTLWVLFHIYSITLVHFTFPGFCLPILLILFLPDFQQESPFLTWREWPGWTVIVSLLGVSSIPYLTPTEQMYTLQAMKFGVSMLDTNRQCVSRTLIHYKSGEKRQNEFAVQASMRRCRVYPIWFRLHRKCETNKKPIERIEWQFLSSANGGPFYELVNVPNVCELTYNTFDQNEWIQIPKEDSKIHGYPRKNFNIGENITANLIYNTPIPMRVPTQEFFFEHRKLILIFWRTLWFALSTFFVVRALRRRFAPT